MVYSRVSVFRAIENIHGIAHPKSKGDFDIVAVGASGYPKPDGIFYVVYRMASRSFELSHIMKKEFRKHGSKELIGIMNYLYVRNYRRKSNSMMSKDYISVIIQDYYSGGVYLPKKYLCNFDELVMHYEVEKKKIIGWVKDYAHGEYIEKLELIYNKVMVENGLINEWEKYLEQSNLEVAV